MGCITHYDTLSVLLSVLTEAIDDVPDGDGVHHPLPPHGVADEPHPHPPDEAAHPHTGEQPAGRAWVNALRYCLVL